MKRALKIALIFLILAVLVGGCYLYFIVFSPKTTASILIYWGNHAMDGGRAHRAVRLYEWAYSLDHTNSSLALRLASSYAESGNYTKAEYVLLTTKQTCPTNLELYTTLSNVFVAQDKLLDAQQLLDHATDPSIADKLAAMRPKAPVFDPEGGYYAEYIELTVKPNDAPVYVSLTEEYPSIASGEYEPVTLPGGATSASAIAVGENGLVSPLTRAEYTISGVVEPVTLKDAAIDQIVRDRLYKTATQQLLTSDLWQIRTLELTDDTKTLEDLSYFINLTDLSLHNLCGSDLSFLASMPKLKKLQLPTCAPTAEMLEQIALCSNLEELDLSGCGLSTVAPLGALKKLRILNLKNNYVADIEPLGECTALTTLDLSGNAVVSVAALENNTELKKLDLSGNSLTDVSALAGCTGLEELNLSSNSLRDISCIGSMPLLRTLSASKNSLLRIEAIGSCKKLERMDMSDNKLESINGVEKIPTLTYININYNDVKEVPDFPDDSPLQQFYAAHNFMEDVEGLRNLQQLNYVDMDYNNIDSNDIQVLLTCPTLVQINTFGTNVDNIDAFANSSIIVNYKPRT